MDKIDFHFTISLKTDVLIKNLTYPELLNIFKNIDFSDEVYIQFIRKIDSLNSIVERFPNNSSEYTKANFIILNRFHEHCDDFFNIYLDLLLNKISNKTEEIEDLLSKWKDLSDRWKSLMNYNDPYVIYYNLIVEIRKKILSQSTSDLNLRIMGIIEKCKFDIEQHEELRNISLIQYEDFNKEIILVKDVFKIVLNKLN